MTHNEDPVYIDEGSKVESGKMFTEDSVTSGF